MLTRLTPREQEIARLYGSGYTHKDISRVLSLSPNTVRVHVGNIFDKLRINSRALLRALLSDQRSSGNNAKCTTSQLDDIE